MPNGALHPSHKPAVRLRLKGAADPEKPPASAGGTVSDAAVRRSDPGRFRSMSPGSTGWRAGVGEFVVTSAFLSSRRRWMLNASPGPCPRDRDGCRRLPVHRRTHPHRKSPNSRGRRAYTQVPRSEGVIQHRPACHGRTLFLPSTGSPLRPDEPSGAVSTCSDMISTQPLRSNHGQRK